MKDFILKIITFMLTLTSCIIVKNTYGFEIMATYGMALIASNIFEDNKN